MSEGTNGAENEAPHNETNKDSNEKSNGRAGIGSKGSDAPFITGLFTIFACYLLLIIALLLADISYISFADVWATLGNPDIQYSIKLTLVSCIITAILSILVAVPTGYVLSRFRFPGKAFCDAILDIPIVLPPLVIGLSLLILFYQVDIAGENIETWCRIIFTNIYVFIFSHEPPFDVGITYKIPAIIVAQFTVSCAFAVRTMRSTYDQLSPRCEQVAMTLGCTRSQAFWLIGVPEAWRGIITATALAWARALGEFGPILIFAGTTRGRTEVLSTSIFLELSTGNLEAAVAISMVLVVIALAVLCLVRLLDSRRGGLYDSF